MHTDNNKSLKCSSSGLICLFHSELILVYKIHHCWTKKKEGKGCLLLRFHLLILTGIGEHLYTCRDGSRGNRDHTSCWHVVITHLFNADVFPSHRQQVLLGVVEFEQGLTSTLTMCYESGSPQSPRSLKTQRLPVGCENPSHQGICCICDYVILAHPCVLISRFI